MSRYLSPAFNGQRLTNRNGQVLANGYIEAYAYPSWSEQKNTYTGQADDDPANPNPVPLTPDGLLTNPIWQADGGYNFSVYDVHGVWQFDLENVNGVGSPSSGGGGGGGATPGGDTPDLQFNDDGTFGGVPSVVDDEIDPDDAWLRLHIHGGEDPNPTMQYWSGPPVGTAETLEIYPTTVIMGNNSGSTIFTPNWSRWVNGDYFNDGDAFCIQAQFAIMGSRSSGDSFYIGADQPEEEDTWWKTQVKFPTGAYGTLLLNWTLQGTFNSYQPTNTAAGWTVNGWAPLDDWGTYADIPLVRGSTEFVYDVSEAGLTGFKFYANQFAPGTTFYFLGGALVRYRPS